MGTTFTDAVDFRGSVNMAGASSVLHKSGSVTNDDIAANAGVDYDKLDHIDLYTTHFDEPIGDTPTVREEVLAIARAAGTIQFCYAGLNDTGTNTDVDFDLEVNGSSVLSAVINVDHNDADRLNVAGTVSSGTVAAGDVISALVATVTSSTGAQGPFMVVGVSYASPT